VLTRVRDCRKRKRRTPDEGHCTLIPSPRDGEGGVSRIRDNIASLHLVVGVETLFALVYMRDKAGPLDTNGVLASIANGWLVLLILSPTNMVS
jgi:hypothetical protein